VLGADPVGEIVEIGDDVVDRKVGDRAFQHGAAMPNSSRFRRASRISFLRNWILQMQPSSHVTLLLRCICWRQKRECALARRFS
jgi:hypothetical protein